MHSLPKNCLIIVLRSLREFDNPCASNSGKDARTRDRNVLAEDIVDGKDHYSPPNVLAPSGFYRIAPGFDFRLNIAW